MLFSINYLKVVTLKGDDETYVIFGSVNYNTRLSSCPTIPLQDPLGSSLPNSPSGASITVYLR